MMNAELKTLLRAVGLAAAAGVGSLCLPCLDAAEVDISKIPPAAKQTVDFEKDIKPLLEGTCLKCHSGEKPKGKYSLETRANMLKESDEGPNVVVGNSAKSPLIHNVSRLVEDKEMPPEGKGDPLTKDQIG